ncbi:MAG TPA: phosphatidate cytidylyltransferase, partial [Longimicrobiaceae bacterium]|nr:phosphatidate cytidylyltransferase [Longimicrobiaceae bacterium]
MALSETATRVAVAAVGIPLAVGAVYLGGFVLGGLLAVVAVLAVLEFYRMAERKAARPLAYLGAAGAAALVLLASSFPEEGPGG